MTRPTENTLEHTTVLVIDAYNYESTLYPIIEQAYQSIQLIYESEPGQQNPFLTRFKELYPEAYSFCVQFLFYEQGRLALSFLSKNDAPNLIGVMGYSVYEDSRGMPAHVRSKLNNPEGYLNLNWMYVQKAYRRQGVARQLFQRFLSHVQAIHPAATPVTLNVHRSSPENLTTAYTRHGFKQIADFDEVSAWPDLRFMSATIDDLAITTKDL